MRSRTVFILVVAMAVASTSGQLAAQGRGRGAGSSKPPASAPAPKPGHTPHSKPAAPSDAAKRPVNAPSSDVAARLQEHPQLAAKLAGLLPPGTNLNTASAGFRNLGQFVAAVHVSKNLGIPFALLRARMTGTNSMSLGQAIQALRPSTKPAEVDREVKRAEREADNDLARDRKEKD